MLKFRYELEDIRNIIMLSECDPTAVFGQESKRNVKQIINKVYERFCMTNNRHSDLVERTIQIGQNQTCSQEDLFLFLPHYPTLRGNEFLFSIGDGNAGRYLSKNVEAFIKGLHRIEMKYKEVSGSQFGFGSPSPTFKVISKLGKSNKPLADCLVEWVAANGGNYYIKPIPPDTLF